MSNINDVIDYLDNLSVESIDETIAKFKGDIEKTSSRIAALETLKRAKLMEIGEPEEPEEFEVPELQVPEPPKSPWAKPHTNGRPAPARSPERQERTEDQAMKIHTWLEVNGRSNVVAIARNTGLHHRRVAGLLKTHPAQFKSHINGEWEAI